jgi:hypothetical protein
VVTRQVPGIKLPRVVRPVLRGKEVEFRDTRTYVEAERGKFPFTQTFHTVNNITDRAVVEGTITVSHAADGQTELHVKGECVVKITGLGGKIESVIVENLKRSYQRLPEIIAEWMTVREAMLANPQPKAPPHVRAPTAGSEGDDESHSPTESDAGSTSSFASANSEIGSVSGTSADGSVDGSHSNPFEATRDNTRRDSRDRSKRLPSLEDARSPQPFPIAPDTPPLDKFLDRFRTAGGVRDFERRERRGQERHRQRGRERRSKGQHARRGLSAGTVLGRKHATGRRVDVLAPSVLLLPGRGAPVGCRLGLGARRRVACERLGRVRLGGRRDVRRAGIHTHTAHAGGEEHEADAVQGWPVTNELIAMMNC